ncbi:taurine ABC transporter ATP-binding protein [Vitreoscilla massiliensis]
MMSDLSLQQVSVQYEGQAAPTLQNISLNIPHDGITVILGPSGCGKTTLLNVLAGFVPINAGEVRDGDKYINAPAADRTVVFQDDALMPWLNVQENVELGLKIQNVPAQQRSAIAKQVLQQVNLSGAEEKQIWELSGGMRQRVGIARALAVRSKYLLMDEPFGALDAFTREQMQDLVLDLWQQNQTGFFLITHDIEEALVLATQLVLMAPFPGRIIDEIEPPFSRQRRAGKSFRQIKSDSAFIDMREYLFTRLNAQDPALYEVSI